MEKKETKVSLTKEEQLEAIKNALLSHQKRMETDPGYRERYEEELAFSKRLFPFHSNGD